MTFKELWDGLCQRLGNALVGSDYTIEEWQESSAENPVDNLARNAHAWKREWALTQEGRILSRHRSDLRARGFGPSLYTIETDGESHAVQYDWPGKSLLLLYGRKSIEEREQETEEREAVRTAAQVFEKLLSPPGQQSLEEATIMERYIAPRTRPSRRHFLACQQFFGDPQKEEIAFKVLTPYQQIPDGKFSWYHHELEALYDMETLSILQIVAIANSFSKSLALPTMPTALTPLGVDWSPEELSLEETLANAIHYHSMQPHENYTRSILLR